MNLNFTKMQGIGNDFVVFDATRQAVVLSPAQLRFIADRRFGIGCDQILLVEAGDSAEVDFVYRIFNADGSEVEQCGNGARCFARFVRDQGLTDRDEIRVRTHSGVIRLYPRIDGQVKIDMGAPCFRPAEIPFQAETEADSYTVEADGRDFTLSAVSMGNPHAVLQVADVDHAPVAATGALLESHPRFPKRVNVGFMQILDPARIRLRVFERGSGETLACGTGACAAVVTGRRRGVLAAKVDVALPGGHVQVEWQGNGNPVWMTGPAMRVYEGTISL